MYETIFRIYLKVTPHFHRKQTKILKIGNAQIQVELIGCYDKLVAIVLFNLE